MEIELGEDAPTGWTAAAVSGEVDVTSVPALAAALDELFEDEGHHLIVDVDAVDFIDSTGLEAFVDAAARARSHGGDLRLVCSNSRLLRVISMARVDETLVVAESDVDASTVVRAV